MQELFLFSDIMLLFQNGYNGNNKNITVVSQSQSFKLSLKFYVLIRSTDGYIRDCLLLNCAFIISDVRQSVVLQFVCKTSKKTTFSVFCRFFSYNCTNLDLDPWGWKSRKRLGLILQDFERLLRWSQLVLALQFSFNPKGTGGGGGGWGCFPLPWWNFCLITFEVDSFSTRNFVTFPNIKCRIRTK